MKEFWKSVYICRSYVQISKGLFLKHGVNCNRLTIYGILFCFLSVSDCFITVYFGADHQFLRTTSSRSTETMTMSLDSTGGCPFHRPLWIPPFQNPGSVPFHDESLRNSSVAVCECARSSNKRSPISPAPPLSLCPRIVRRPCAILPSAIF